MSFHTPSRTSMESDVPSRVWTSPIRQRVIGSTPSTYTVSYPGHETNHPTPSPGAFESPLCRPLVSPTKQRPTSATKDSTYSATIGQAGGQADYAINKNRVVLPRALSPFRSTSSYADSYNTSQSQLPFSASNVPVTTPPPATPPPAAPSQTVTAAQPAPAPLSTPTPAPLNLSHASTPQSRSSLNNDLRSPPSKRAYAGPTDHGDRSKSPMSTTKEAYGPIGAVPRAVSPRSVREEYQHQQQRYTGPTDGGLRIGTPATTYVENFNSKPIPQHSNGTQERARSPRVNTGLQRSVSPLPFGAPQTEDSTYRTAYTQLSQRPPAHEYPDATRHFSPSRARSPLPSGGPTGTSSYTTAYGTATAVSPRATTTTVPSTPPPAYSASPQSVSNRLISPRSTDEIIPAGVPHLSVRPERPPATAIHHTSEYYENFTKPGHSGPAALPAAGDHSKMTRRTVEERPARSPSTGNLNTTYNRDFTIPKERSLFASTCSELTLNPAEAPTRADHRGGITSPVAVRRAASPFGGDVSTSYSASFNGTVSPSRGASTRAAPEALPPASRPRQR